MRSISAVRITTRTMLASRSVRANVSSAPAPSSGSIQRSWKAIDPARRISQHDETAAHDQREPPIEPSRRRVRRPSCARAVEAEQPEVLRGKVVAHQHVVHDGEPDCALGHGHRQHAFGNEQQREAGHRDCHGGHDEAQPLRREQRAVRRGRVQASQAERDAVTEPQRHDEREEQRVHRARAGVVVTPREQHDHGSQPQRIQDPDEVPCRAPDPARGRGR